MNDLIYATTVEHALSLWAALQLDIDWSALKPGESPPLSAGWLDVTLVGAVARRDEKAYEIIDGVPVIRHEGSMSKYPSVGRIINITRRTRTYSEIAEALYEAADDRKAQTRPLVVLDTFGGGVDGHSELVRAMRDTGAEIFVERGTSAGTWLAAAASRVTVAHHGVMGSVGVISIPVDVSARLEQEGIRPVPIVSDGAEVKAIGGDGVVDEKYIAKVKPHLNATAKQFQSAVREGRDLEPEQAAKVFTADCWIGEENVHLGLADAVASDVREVIQTMAARRRSTTKTGGQPMSDVPKIEAGDGDLEARLKLLEDQLAEERQARATDLEAAQVAHQADLARLQAVETERTVDKLFAQCAAAPPCLTEGRDLRGFLTAAIDGGWTINVHDGEDVTKISAAEFVVNMVGAVSGLADLTGDEELAAEEAPYESKRQQGFDAAEEDEELQAEEESFGAVLDEIWAGRTGGSAQ